MQEWDVDAWTRELHALFEQRRGKWFAHPRRLSDQDVHLVGVELQEECVDVLLGDRLLDEPSVFRLRISRSSMEDTPERFLADNIFVELLEFIESTSSRGLPDPGGGEVLIQYA